MSTTGAGIDSFFEYVAKAYILLGDDEYYRIWSEAYAAVMKFQRSNDGFWVILR
jgi:mannosidase alpha-like ER degradation enhancer 1